MVAYNPVRWAARILPFLLPFACGNAAAAVAADASDHRIVLYYQTFTLNNTENGHVSLLPLLDTGVTHVLVSAVHIQDDDGGIHLNDLPPGDPAFDAVWSDAAQIQAAGIAVMAMVGGAAAGSWPRLDGDDASFEAYYAPLHDMIAGYNLQGLDLDVEQSMSLEGVIRLIDRLKADFGDDFIITLAPVASALSGGGNLSGFDYRELEAQRGDQIAFYNAQFYYGWGDASSTSDYDAIIDDGFPSEKVVMGLLTSPSNGNNYVDLDTQRTVLEALVTEYPTFGGVAGWEYFNSLPGGTAAPYEWAATMADDMAAAVAKGRREISTSERVARAIKTAGRRVRRRANKVYKDYIA
ncbi:glycoside hydrolase superfamily [Xylariomycetidae sp. FL2044]|nr:glycoside hydrolase superfamily [Xylariomycetidae sp. FL2044]